MKELISEYGPVDRFWFDGTSLHPQDLDTDKLWDDVYGLLRTDSPNTMIGPYRGDVCMSTGSLYLNDGPLPNSSNTRTCAQSNPRGKYFHPSELHGITMQEGPDGNTDEMPTYWFWSV